MKGKFIRINNLDKLTYKEHRKIAPLWQVVQTFHRNEFETGINQYEIYLEKTGVIPPYVLQINISGTVKSIVIVGLEKTNEFLEVEILRYTNTSTASTSSTKTWKTQVDIEKLKTLEDFKEYIREGLIPLFGKL